MSTLEPASQADATRLLEEGFNFHRRSMLDDAAVRYRRVLALDPGSYEALQLFGLVPHLSGAHLESVRRLSRATAVESREETWRNLAVVWLEAGHFARSSRAARRAIALNPTRPTYGLLAESLYGLGQSVFNLTTRRLATDAHDAGAWLLLGMTAGADRGALVFRRALAAAPVLVPAALAVATTSEG
jgi:Tfp pilus assembly protein PilF